LEIEFHYKLLPVFESAYLEKNGTSCSYVQRVAGGMVAWGSGMVAWSSGMVGGGMMAYYSGSGTFVLRNADHPSVLVHNDRLVAVSDAEIKLTVNLTLG
jgi:hypothetical protein